MSDVAIGRQDGTVTGTNRRSRRRRPTLAVAAGLGMLAVLAVSGCSVDSAGAAAVVGDQRVTEATVAADVAAVQAQVPAATFDPAAVTKATVERLTRAAVVSVASAREGIVVTPSQVDQLLDTTAKSTGGMDKLEQALVTQYSVPSSAVSSYALTFLEQQALAKKIAPNATDGGEAELTDYLGALSAELDTQVSPRFGTWDAKTLTVGAVPTDLASPASSPLASPPAVPVP